MSVITILIYCLVGFIFFTLLYFLRHKYKISRLYNTLFSIFLLVITATIFNYLKLDYLNENIFLIFLFQFIFDFMYTTYILEEDFFIKNEANLLYYLLLIFFGVFLNNVFINKVDQIFLTGEEFRLLVWTFLFIFIYKFIKEEKIFENSYHTNKLLDEGNVLTMFTKLRRRYLNDIMVNDLQLKLAIYSIMIVNNSKRSPILRYFDNIIFRITGRKRKLGIMQIESKTFITDIESIDLVTKDIKKLIGKKSGSGTYESALSTYMGDNNLEVLEVYNILKNFFKI